MDFINLKQQYNRAKSAINQQINNVLEHGQFIMGPEVKQLETRLCEWVEMKHCVGLSSGTTALEIALRALGVGQGDEVITPVFSFMATAAVPALLGATPVMVDIEPKTYNLDPTLLKAAITKKTKAIIVVDLYGQCADYDAIWEIAHQYNIPVIEDAAQSLGGLYKDRPACSLATIACTSFFPSKPLACYGDAGACFSNDAALADKMRSLINHGQTERYQHTQLGTNARIDTLQCAILLAKLDLFAEEIELRQTVAKYYNDALKNIVSMRPYIEPHNQSVFAQYTIQVPHREAVRKALAEMNIPTAVHYPMPMHQQLAMTPYPCHHQTFPVAEQASQSVMSLPFWPYMSEAEVQKVANALQECLSCVCDSVSL
ncbi:MAG: aminotransferase DegT [Gammaproteobacteria bacterium RIFCSPHIGHO2_12_FULL_41_15]|nr:MAG: aminotransferase DegT [Gammaproteobacteria bacterium RIFCSPHIGHO2_12_FULL_41_15]